MDFKEKSNEFLEQTKDFFSNAASMTSSLFKKYDDLDKLLESKNEVDVLDGLTYLISNTSQGKNMSKYFPIVIKSIASKNDCLRKLVCLLVSLYSSSNEDASLLCISTLQKGLKNSNHLIRGECLKTLMNLNSSLVISIQFQAIVQASTDASWYVKTIACEGIITLCKRLHELDIGEIVNILIKFLNDTSLLVLGTALQVLFACFPDRIDLLHPHYRFICNNLVNFDEHSTFAALELLLLYVRANFVDQRCAEKVIDTNEIPSIDDDLTEKLNQPRLEPDVELLLSAVRILFYHQNSCVKISAMRLYVYCAPESYCDYVKAPLEHLINSSPEMRNVTYNQIEGLITLRPSIFKFMYKSFFLNAGDSLATKKKKMDILIKLIDENNMDQILAELEFYTHYPTIDVSTYAVHSLGLCAINYSPSSLRISNELTQLLYSNRQSVMAETVIVIRALIQINGKSQDPTVANSKNSIIEKLALIFKDIKEPNSRESILWLISEYCETALHLAPDILRIAAKNFSAESNCVKHQIINLASRLILLDVSSVTISLCNYVFTLAKYDKDIDIRDRTRFLSNLVQYRSDSTKLLQSKLQKIIFAPKPIPEFSKSIESNFAYEIGTISYTVKAKIEGYKALPEFPTVSSDPKLREPVVNIISDIHSEKSPASDVEEEEIEEVEEEEVEEEAVEEEVVEEIEVDEFNDKDVQVEVENEEDVEYEDDIEEENQEEYVGISSDHEEANKKGKSGH